MTVCCVVRLSRESFTLGIPTIAHVLEDIKKSGVILPMYLDQVEVLEPTFLSQ